MYSWWCVSTFSQCTKMKSNYPGYERCHLVAVASFGTTVWAVVIWLQPMQLVDSITCGAQLSFMTWKLCLIASRQRNTLLDMYFDGLVCPVSYLLKWRRWDLQAIPQLAIWGKSRYFGLIFGVRSSCPSLCMSMFNTIQTCPICMQVKIWSDGGGKVGSGLASPKSSARDYQCLN